MAWQSTEIAFALLIQPPRVRTSTIAKYSNKQSFKRSEQRVTTLCTAVLNCKLARVPLALIIEHWKKWQSLRQDNLAKLTQAGHGCSKGLILVTSRHSLTN